MEIRNLTDLICIILRKHYQGATNLKEMEDYLVRVGVLQKSLTISMLDQTNRIVINDKEISLAELVSC